MFPPPLAGWQREQLVTRQRPHSSSGREGGIGKRRRSCWVAPPDTRLGRHIAATPVPPGGCNLPRGGLPSSKSGKRWRMRSLPRCTANLPHRHSIDFRRKEGWLSWWWLSMRSCSGCEDEEEEEEEIPLLSATPALQQRYRARREPPSDPSHQHHHHLHHTSAITLTTSVHHHLLLSDHPPTLSQQV